MNLDGDALKQLHAGKTVDVHVTRTYQAGRSYKTGDYRVLVLEVMDERPVGFLLRIQLDRTREDTPRLLHRNSQNGYTGTPSMALNREPEAVDADTQHRITKAAQENRAVARAAELAEQEIKSATRRMRQDLLELSRDGVSTAEFLTRLRRELDGLREGRAA